MTTDESLSSKQECVGFFHEIEFKDKYGNVKMFPATRGEMGVKSKDVKSAVRKILKRIGNEGEIPCAEVIVIIKQELGEEITNG